MRKIILFAMFLFSVYLVSAACPDGMVSYWKLNDGSGIKAADSGYGNNGTLINGPGWNSSGQVGGALMFDGNNDYISIPSLNNMSYRPVTYEAWVKLKSFPCSGTNCFSVIVGREERGNAKQGVVVVYGKITDGNLYHFVYYTGGNGVDSNYAATLGNWTHIAFVQTNTTATWYINGVMTNNVTFTAAQDAIIPFRIGSGDISKYFGFFNGTIDEVAVYNRALNASEIFKHYTNSLNGSGYCDIAEQQELIPEVSSKSTASIFALLIVALLIGALLLRKK